MDRALTRRTLLGTGLAAAAAGGLAACGGGKESEERTTENRNVVLPTYQQVELVQPDLPGNEVLMPGYYSYPRDPKKVFDTPPGAPLDELSMMYTTFIPAPKGPESNSFWAQLQEDIGTTLKLQPVSSGDYDKKFQTLIAGGDMPDIMNFPLPTPNQPQMMEKVFADLGPYLSGDAAKEFPYLANIPEVSWPVGIANGSIYAVPQPRAITGQVLYYRKDLFDEYGITHEPADYDEFIGTFEAYTDRDKDRFAFSNIGQMHYRILGMMGGPNKWSVSDDGTFTPQYLDPIYRESLAMMPELVKKYAHPESHTAPYAQHREFFYHGNCCYLHDGYAGWDLYVRGLQGAVDKLGMMVQPKFDGGGDGPQFTSKSYQGITVINKKLTGEKLRAAVDVLNFLCAPIGSLEHLHRKFGKEGKDWEWKGDTVELTEEGQRAFMDFQYIADAPTVLGPGAQEEVQPQHAYMERMSKVLVDDPSMGLYSDTHSRKSDTIGRPMSDVIEGIYVGRNTMDDFDAAVKKWRNDGADKIAEEYAEAYAATQ